MIIARGLTFHRAPIPRGMSLPVINLSDTPMQLSDTLVEHLPIGRELGSCSRGIDDMWS